MSADRTANAIAGVGASGAMLASMTLNEWAAAVGIFVALASLGINIGHFTLKMRNARAEHRARMRRIESGED